MTFIMKTPDVNRLFTLILPGIVGFTLFISGCAGVDGADTQSTLNNNGTSRRSVQVETLVLQPTTFEDVIELTGTVEALNDATLSAQSAGSVTSLLALGRTVRAGQTVAQLDPGIMQAAVQQAEAMVSVAQAQFDLTEDVLNRQRPLFRDSVISALEFENVRAQYNQAEAQLKQVKAALTQAEKQLNNTRVTTPFTGTVEAHFVEVGEQVMPGTPVVRVINTSRVKVTVGVPERYAGDITSGTSLQIDFKAYRGEVYSGKVTFVGNAISPQNRTFPIEIELDNRESTLKPEMIANLYVVREQYKDVLVIPRAAVIRDEEGHSVFVVSRNGSDTYAESHMVTLGPAYGEHVIVSGVEAGTEVVVLGQNTLAEGDLVQIVRQYRTIDETDKTDTIEEHPA